MYITYIQNTYAFQPNNTKSPGIQTHSHVLKLTQMRNDIEGNESIQVLKFKYTSKSVCRIEGIIILK